MVYIKDKNQFSFFSLLKRNLLLKHILFAVLILVLLFLIWLKSLSFYTLHGKHIQIPDFQNFSINKLDSIFNEYNLRYIIIDSIFDGNRAKGIVVGQDPAPFTDVKRRRRVYLTINALQQKKVLFPNIYDLSLRQAIRELEKIGLEVGELEYRVDIATNKVLDFKVNGMTIQKDQELYVGTVIDLVVGKGLSDETVVVPNLIGLTMVEANIILKSTSLNIGLEIFKSSVKDSSLAVIYNQYPIHNEEKKINIGSSIDLYFDSPSVRDNSN